jgi:hypothetical protein
LRSEERKRGVTVKTLDMTPLYERIAEGVRDKIKPDVTAVTTPYNWALATDRYGRSYLVCDEGVYWPIGNDDEVRPSGTFGPTDFDVFDATERYSASGNRTMSIMALATVKLSLSDVEPLVSGEDDLADFVRTFGARLEQNFWNLREEITGGNNA